MKNIEIEYLQARKRASEQLEAAKVFDYKEPQIAHDIRETVYAIFPGLREPEDERMRKELIKETKRSDVRLFETVTNEEFVAFLEKQGEQKPVCRHP